MLPVTSFKNTLWESIAEELWPVVAKSVNAARLARQVSNIHKYYIYGLAHKHIRLSDSILFTDVHDLNVSTLQGRVASTGTRDSTLEILIGDNGWVDHRENGSLFF